MNNQAPSRRAPNHSISVQSTSLLSRAHGSLQFPHPLLSLESRRDVSKRERKRERQREREKKGVDTSKDKEEVGALDRGGTAGEGGETGCGTAIIVAFPTDKVTAREYFLFPAADRARITRKES